MAEHGGREAHENFPPRKGLRIDSVVSFNQARAQVPKHQQSYMYRYVASSNTSRQTRSI